MTTTTLSVTKDTFFPGVKKAVKRKTVFWSNAFYAQYINLQMDFQKTNDVFSTNKKKKKS